jgi:hypothetical protein
MPRITIYNDSETDLDADFDVVELIGGKEANRTTMKPDDSSCEGFRLYASNQAFLIVPRGAQCPKISMSRKGTQIDARPKEP